MATVNESNTSNNTRTEQYTVTPGTNSLYVYSASELQQALNDGILDITLDAAVNAPSGGINVPRISGGRTLRCTSRGILSRGSDTGHVLRADGSGGRLTLKGFRVDGGWRTRLYEQGDDSRSNYALPAHTYLRIEDCVTCYSLRTGYFVYSCGTLEIVRSTLFACPRDHAWADNVRDLLVENCLIQHCGDDSLGTHQWANQGLITQSIIFRGNTVRDSLGGKLHCGAADGTYNGKTSQILYDNNVMVACGLYGVHGHEPPPEQNHNISAPKNVKIRGNTFENLRKTCPVSPGQTIGVAVRQSFPSFSFDSSFEVKNNTFIRDGSIQGKKLGEVYSWPVPSNVPGASSYQGKFFSKTGFGDFTFDMATQATLFQGGNTGSVTHSGNVYEGSGWTSTLS